MYETFTTVVGTIIGDPKRRRFGDTGDEVLNLRVAANVRRLDRASGEWRDGAKLYVTVTCWNRMVQNVAATLAKGDPIIAFGELQTASYTNKDGEQRSVLELRARSVGPDLGRCQATVTRRPVVRRDPGEAAVEGGAAEGAASPAAEPGAQFGIAPEPEVDQEYLDAVADGSPGDEADLGDEADRFAA